MRTLRLVWPREVTPAQLTAAMRLLASTGGTPLVLEAVGQYRRVEHWLRVDDGKASAITIQLRVAIPGLGVEGADEHQPEIFTRAMRLRFSTSRRMVDTSSLETVSTALITALAHVGKDEALLLQWMLQDRLLPEAVPSKIDQLHPEKWWQAALQAPLVGFGPVDAETRSAIRSKRAEPGWRVLGRIAVRAASRSREFQLLRGVLQALRTAEAPGVHIGARSLNPSRLIGLHGRGSVRLNLSELSTLCAWPVGETRELPVLKLGSRRLPAASAIPRSGRVIGESNWPGKERSLALSAEDSLRHLHVLGPTGTGKSTLLLNLIEQDMKRGSAVVVIEPKGDLITDVLERVPKDRHSDVVLLDPTDHEAPVGLNPLAVCGGPEARELAADQLLATFHGLYAAHWGPRTSDILHASLLTIARTPGMSLVALPLLLGDATFRRKLIGSLHDPIGLGSFWAGFEAWSESERQAAIAPVMNKLRPFLMRPSLRRIVGQTEPRFSLSTVFTERKILLVNLSKGLIGSEGASLLGALVIAGLWRAAQGRSAIIRENRHPVFVFIDEFQDYLHLPTDLDEALAQARSLGLAFTLAHQHLNQLPPSMRAGVLANARSRICFQLGADDAKTMSQHATLLRAEDFSSLAAFEFYAQLTSSGAVQPWCSGRSFPPSKPNAGAEPIRKISSERYGTPIADVDAQLEALLTRSSATRRRNSSDDLGPKRRASGGSS